MQDYSARPDHRNSPARKACLIIAALCLLLPASAGANHPGPTSLADAPLARLLPQETVVTLSIRNGAQAVESLRNSPLLEAYLESDAYEALKQRPDFLKAQGGLLLMAGSVRLDPWGLIGQALGREALLALIPGEKKDKPHAVLIIRPDDAAAAGRIVENLLILSGARAGTQPAKNRSREVDGITGYKISDEAFLAELDGLIVVSNHAETLERLVKSRKSDGNKLAGVADYRMAAEAVPSAAPLWGFVNVARLRESSPEGFEKKLDNAFAAMLLSGSIDTLRSADAVVAWASADRDSLEITARSLGGKSPKHVHHFTVAANDARDWSRFKLPGLVAELDLSRAWMGLWDDRERMLDEEGLRGLAEFAATLTTIMGSLDFSGELLPELRPTLRMLAVRQEFEGAAPTPALPGFALLLPLRNPEKLAAKLDNAALMALSIVNLDMGQKMQPQYTISLESHAGTRYTVAKFPPNLDPGPRGIRYNFEPAIAVVEDQFVIATSRALLTQFIDAYKELPKLAATASSSAAAADRLTIDLRNLHAVLTANREAFVTQRMLEQDIEREQAADDVAALLDVARLFTDFQVVTSLEDDSAKLCARLVWNVPEKKSAEAEETERP